MPDYRLVYLLTYRVVASGDTDASRKVMDALTSSFPNVKFTLITSDESATQSVAGATTFDVQLLASGVVTATGITNSLNKITPPQQNLVNSLQLASIDTRVEGQL